MAKKAQANTGDKVTLTATVRKETGKQVKKLRKDGFIPANIFGQGFESKSITLNSKDFTTAYKIAKETGLIYVEVDKDSIPTLISQIQRHPVNDSLLHIDFRKVNLKQKVETAVPVQFVGTSEAVSVHAGVMLTQSNTLIIEALPTDIPPHIEVDISAIKEIGQDIKVSDLPKSDKYEIKEDPTKVIVSVTAHKEESVTPETEKVETEVITAKPEEGAEGAAPAEGAATPAAEEKKEEKK